MEPLPFHSSSSKKGKEGESERKPAAIRNEGLSRHSGIYIGKDLIDAH